MADSIGDLLDISRFEEPEEVQIIKSYIDEQFHSPARVTMQEKQIIITVAGASLAGALRLKLYELQKLCNTDKRLVIRIG